MGESVQALGVWRGGGLESEPVSAKHTLSLLLPLLVQSSLLVALSHPRVWVCPELACPQLHLSFFFIIFSLELPDTSSSFGVLLASSL